MHALTLPPTPTTSSQNHQKTMQHLLHFLPPPPPPHLPTLPSPSLPLLLPRRRSLALSLPLLFLPITPSSAATTTTTDCTTTITLPSSTTTTAFLDVSIDNTPIGRITIALLPPSPATARFSSLLSGSIPGGITYRRKDFTKIMPNYIQHAGVRSDGDPPEAVVAEYEAARACVKMTAGMVGLVVRDPERPPPKTKVVARKGRLEVVEEEVGVGPNGTEFVIARRREAAPELEERVVVVGRVVEGMEVVERIGEVKTVKENTTSPYFRVAKLIGDKRAVVAERGFNRPYSKVVITNCGLLN